VAALVVVTVVGGAPATAPTLVTVRPASFRPPLPYWKPVVTGGKVFPVARSATFSLLEFSNDWHAVRLRLVNGKWKPVGVHEGIDITAEPGTPVLSMTTGVVENVGWLFYSGMRVGVRGADGRYYFYCHFSRVAAGIRPGVHVRLGQVLGLVGNTGYGPPGHRDEFPPHLHFGIAQGSEWVDPYRTLVALYQAATDQGRRTERALDMLARRGDRDGWNRLAGHSFTSFGL
jgi:murein DD-endopeptidase MepM/ murein hydrolase activator NlpD